MPYNDGRKHYSSDVQFDIMSVVPAKIDWDDQYAVLMAEPFTNEPPPSTMVDMVELVQYCMSRLSPKDIFILNAIYVWGKSLQELAEMLGYKSKGSGAGHLKKAEHNLKEMILLTTKEIKMKKGTWQDAAWTQLKRLHDTKFNEAHIAMRTDEFGTTMTPEAYLEYNLEHAFLVLGRAVKLYGTDETYHTEQMYETCRSVGEYVVHFLKYPNINLWDMERMADILARKQSDYGHDNINAFGIVGVAVRMSDKIARYMNLCDGDETVFNETLIDTLDDMIGYSVIASMLGDGTFDLKLGELL